MIFHISSVEYDHVTSNRAAHKINQYINTFLSLNESKEINKHCRYIVLHFHHPLMYNAEKTSPWQNLIVDPCCKEYPL